MKRPGLDDSNMMIVPTAAEAAQLKGFRGMRVECTAPARADLFNTHQDYKGLPVVTAALSLRLKVSGALLSSNRVFAYSSTVGDAYEFSVDDLSFTGGWVDYLKAVLRALHRRGFSFKGFELVVNSEIPIGSGLGSSGSLVVALTGFLSKLFNYRFSPKDIAELAYCAEHDELGVPCGRLDQYAAALGGMLLIETKPPHRVSQFKITDLHFIVVDSGERHSTKSVHSARQRELNEAIQQLLEQPLPLETRRKLQGDFSSVKWSLLTEEELQSYLEALPKTLKGRVLFTLKMLHSTLRAIHILQALSVEPSRMLLEELGAVMNEQHLLLRDLYEVSTSRLEELRQQLLEAGALGVKITGAGMGGCLIALVSSKEHGERVLKRLESSGAVPQAWLLRLDTGVLCALQHR